MKLGDVFLMSARNVRKGGVKAALCILAICVGMTSVCTISAAGTAAAETVSAEIDRIGIKGLAFYSESDAYTVDMECMAAVKNIGGVKAAMPLSLNYASARLRSMQFSALAIGCGQELPDIFNIELLHGEHISGEDIRTRARVALIDDEMAMLAYSRANVTGKSLSISFGGITESFVIKGVISSQKSGLDMIAGGGIPHMIYLPYSTVDGISTARTSDKIAVSLERNDSAETAAEKAVRTLENLTGAGFSYENLDGYADKLVNITDTVSLLISAVASIAVVVGGIGVMNSMVSAVEARTREIGIYLAVGARRRDIVGLFLSEACRLCLIGGACGAALSMLIFAAASRVFSLHIALSSSMLLYGLGVPVICGLLFGILPACHAAMLTPIEAIREE